MMTTMPTPTLTPGAPISLNERRAIAVHESGHALAALACGVPVDYVTVNDTGGLTALDDSGFPLATRLLITASGPAAQQMICPREWKRSLWGSSAGSDGERFAEQLREAGSAWWTVERETLAKARRLVEANRSAIIDLADLLLACECGRVEYRGGVFIESAPGTSIPTRKPARQPAPVKLNLSDDEAWAICLHEASHAAAAHFSGVQVHYLRIDDTGGTCSFVVPADNRTHLLIIGAGPAGEQELSPPVPGRNPWGKSDEAKYSELLAKEPASERDEVNMEILTEAVELVNREREGIVNLAARLSVRKRVEGRDVPGFFRR